MAVMVDYYLARQSPWVYLGHARFVAMTRASGAGVRVKPVDLGGQVFPVSGGLPLGQRAPQRQAYRLVELARFAQWLELPLHVQPRYFPVAGDPAAWLIVAAQERLGCEASLRLTGAVAQAAWAQQRDIADPDELVALLASCELPSDLVEESQSETIKAIYQANTDEAVAAGVFGAPTYGIEGELFWGQDRLDFVQRRLERG
jgi:2-hydroxychromene-2-carboxylate isomerase